MFSIRSASVMVVAVVATFVLCAWPRRAPAMLQTAVHASSSANPTVDPKTHLGKGQINFDPALTLAPSAAPTSQPTQLSLHAFQLSVSYDPSLVASIDAVTPVAPFTGSFTFSTQSVPGGGGPVPVPPSQILHVSGTAVSDAPVGDVDMFTVDFTLNPALPANTPVTFTLSANGFVGETQDFVEGFDPNNRAFDVTLSGPANIDPASATVFAAGAAGIPLPPALASAALTLALLATAAAARRRFGARRAA